MTGRTDAEKAEAVGQDDETRGQIDLVVRSATPRLRAAKWKQAYEGEDGLGAWVQTHRGLTLIHSVARQEDDGHVWAHVSLSRKDRVMPTWAQTRDAWWLIYPDVYGIIVVAPHQQHVNLAEVAHVWGNLDRPAVPDFTAGTGSI